MLLLRWCRGWAAIALLCTGCRSEQVAFTFRPASPPTSTPASGTPPATAAPAPSVAPRPAPTPVAPAATPVRPGPRQGARAPQVAQHTHHQVTIRRRPEAAARRHPQLPAKRDTFHLLLGGLLIAAGVVTGLLLGGWLGLGVGALIVILGYYFVVLGMGGQHAWLEIFQEFFNM
ncbi:hypothetical protein [Hymenobacter glacieicola]|uniref:hypothetical protein n=1 Tax=Hymenobacter glacieicola TaxID=1562124 RepID=UPI0016699CE3|nr:hypothetical protein [Hymenobacter glacieicola]